MVEIEMKKRIYDESESSIDTRENARSLFPKNHLLTSASWTFRPSSHPIWRPILGAIAAMIIISSCVYHGMGGKWKRMFSKKICVMRMDFDCELKLNWEIYDELMWTRRAKIGGFCSLFSLALPNHCVCHVRVSNSRLWSLYTHVAKKWQFTISGFLG